LKKQTRRDPHSTMLTPKVTQISATTAHPIKRKRT